MRFKLGDLVDVESVLVNVPDEMGLVVDVHMFIDVYVFSISRIKTYTEDRLNMLSCF